MFKWLKKKLYYHRLAFGYYHSLEASSGTDHAFFMLMNIIRDELGDVQNVKIEEYTYKDLTKFYISYRDCKNLHNIASELNVRHKALYIRFRECGGYPVGEGMLFDTRESAQKAVDWCESILLMKILSQGA
jgi:hypothetical protein